jgi:hypothetical protein
LNSGTEEDAAWVRKHAEIVTSTHKHKYQQGTHSYRKNAANRYRINQELKFLYKKKSMLNKQLYTAHLQCAN